MYHHMILYDILCTVYIIMAIFIIECCSITCTCYALVCCFHCDVAACGTLHAQIDVSLSYALFEIL